MPYRLSAFTDEISTDIQEQIDGLLNNGLKTGAVRGAFGKNVMLFEDFQAKMIQEQYHHRGVNFSCIGSPVGKILITDPFEPELERLRRAAALAKIFQTKAVRVFTFFIPKGESPAKHRDEVLRRMKELTELAKELGINLIIENEKDLYGDTPDRQYDVLQHIQGPNVRAAFDFANFVQIGVDTMKAWNLLRPLVVDIHIKDARKSDGREVPAGEGDGQVREILKNAFENNWAGYLTFEPHLSESGVFQGFTGPKLFKVAVDSLRKILTEVGAK